MIQRLLPFFTLGFFLFTTSVSAEDIDNGFIKQNAYVTENYRIEFSDFILGQEDGDNNDLPDVVDIVAEAAEYSRDVLIEDLNYEDPMDGTDRKLIIILDDTGQYLSQGSLGVTSVLSNGDPYVAIDPWLSEDYLKVTVGHELFHTVQFGYGIDFAYTYTGAHWAEETATWVEDIQYDDVNDYVNYIAEYFDYVDYSIFASVVPDGSLFEYGLNVWPRFLSEYYSNDTIKDIWEAYFDSSVSYDSDLRLYETVKDIVSSEGDELWEIYREFTLWNLDLGDYEEGHSYPGVLYLDGETDADYQQINETYAPALFGTNYIYFDNEARDASFYFNIVKPEGISFSVTLVPEDNGSVDLDSAVYAFIDTDETMDEVLELDTLSSHDGVYAIVSPLEKDAGDFNGVTDFDEGFLYYFFAQFDDAGQDYSVDSSDADEDLGETSTDEKEGEQSTGEDVRISDDLVLSVVSYDEDSVSFSWNRLNDTDIEGYELRYGTDKDDYDDTLEITADYITSASVKQLEEGETYYFEIIALEADGTTMGSPSTQVSVTLAEWIFTDVSYMDEYYDAISVLTEEGIFKGYADGSFQPDSDINRAELLKILIEGQGVTPDSSVYKNCFTDVKTDWYAKYVCYAKAEGWIQGYSDGSFRPSSTVNKVEALKMLFEVYEEGLQEGQVVADLPYDDLSTHAWYSIYVDEASELGILEETPGENFEPTDGRTRGQMSLELYRYLVVMELIKE